MKKAQAEDWNDSGQYPSKWVAHFVRVAALIVLVVGAVSLGGWVTGLSSLFQIAPGTGSVHFLTGTVMAAWGGAVLMQSFNRNSLAWIFVLVAILVNLLGASEYLRGDSFAITTTIYKLLPTIHVHPTPRMSGNTALGFLAASLALAAQLYRHLPLRDIVTTSLAAVSFGLGSVGIAAIVTELFQVDSWTSYAGMSPQSAIALLFCGSVTMLREVSGGVKRKGRWLKLVSIPIFLFAEILALGTWRIIDNLEERHIGNELEQHALSVNSRVLREMDRYVERLQGIGRRIANGSYLNHDRWRLDAQRLTGGPNGFSHILKLKSDLSLEPLGVVGSKITRLTRFDFPIDSGRLETIRAAVAGKTLRVFESAGPRGGGSVELYLPIHIENR